MHTAEKILFPQPLTFGADYPRDVQKGQALVRSSSVAAGDIPDRGRGGRDTERH